MKRIRTLLVLFAAVALLALVACGGNTNYYSVSLVYDPDRGSATLTEGSGGDGQYAEGESVTLTVTPKSGFEVEEVQFNGTKVTLSDNKYTFTVTGDADISVIFRQKQTEYYAVSFLEYDPDAVEASLTSPAFGSEYAAGESVTLTVRAKSGYEIEKVLVNGKEVALKDGSYTFAVTQDTLIEISYHAVTPPAPTAYSVMLGEIDASRGSASLSAPENGTSYAAGESVTLTVTPKQGFVIDRVLVNGKEVELSEGKYTFAVTQDTVIAVTFKAFTYKLTIAEYDKAHIAVLTTAPKDGNRNREYTPGESADLFVYTAEGWTPTVRVGNELATLQDGVLPLTMDRDLTVTVTAEKTGEENTDVTFPDSWLGAYESLDGSSVAVIFLHDTIYIADGKVQESELYAETYGSGEDAETIYTLECEEDIFELYLFAENILAVDNYDDPPYYIAVDFEQPTVNPFLYDTYLSEETDDLVVSETGIVWGESTVTVVADISEEPENNLYYFAYYLVADGALWQFSYSWSPDFTHVTFYNAFDLSAYAFEKLGDLLCSVTVAPTENGSVEVSAPQEGAKYQPGETVFITVTPAEGYELSVLLVNGEPVKVTNGKYSFKIGTDTTILALFGKQGTLVNFPERYHGSFTLRLSSGSAGDHTLLIAEKAILIFDKSGSFEIPQANFVSGVYTVVWNGITYELKLHRLTEDALLLVSPASTLVFVKNGLPEAHFDPELTGEYVSAQGDSIHITTFGDFWNDSADILVLKDESRADAFSYLVLIGDDVYRLTFDAETRTVTLTDGEGTATAFPEKDPNAIRLDPAWIGSWNILTTNSKNLQIDTVTLTETEVTIVASGKVADAKIIEYDTGSGGIGQITILWDGQTYHFTMQPSTGNYVFYMTDDSYANYWYFLKDGDLPDISVNADLYGTYKNINGDPDNLTVSKDGITYGGKDFLILSEQVKDNGDITYVGIYDGVLYTAYFYEEDGKLYVNFYSLVFSAHFNEDFVRS